AEPESDVARQAEMVPRHEQHAVLGPHPLHQVEGADPLTVLHQADRSRLRRVPGERVTEALQPPLDQRVVGPEDSARARDPRSAPWYTSSASSQAPTSAARATISRRMASDSTWPVGLWGLVTTTSLVPGAIALRTSSAAGSQPASGCSAKPRTRAPKFWARPHVCR